MKVETFMEKFKKSLELRQVSGGVAEGENTLVSASQAVTDSDVSDNESGTGEQADVVEIEDYDSATDYEPVDPNILSGNENSQSVLGSSDDDLSQDVFEQSDGDKPPSASVVTSYESMVSILYENEKKNSPYDTTGVDLLREIYFDLTNCGNNKTFARMPSSIRDGLLTIPDKTNNRYDLTSSFDDEKGERTRLLAAAVTNSYGNALKLTKLLVEVAKKRSITQRENIKVPKGYEGGLTIPNWIYSTMTVLKGTAIDSEVSEFLLKTQTENKKPDMVVEDSRAPPLFSAQQKHSFSPSNRSIRIKVNKLLRETKTKLSKEALSDLLEEVGKLNADDFKNLDGSSTLFIEAAKRPVKDETSTVQIVQAMLKRIPNNDDVLRIQNSEGKIAREVAQERGNYKVAAMLDKRSTISNTQITSLLYKNTTQIQMKDKIWKCVTQKERRGKKGTGKLDLFTNKTRMLNLAGGNVFEDYILTVMDDEENQTMIRQKLYQGKTNRKTYEKDLEERFAVFNEHFASIDISEQDTQEGFDSEVSKDPDQLGTLGKLITCKADGVYGDIDDLTKYTEGHVVEVKCRYGVLTNRVENSNISNEIFYIEPNYIMQVLVEMQVFKKKKAYFVDFYALGNWYSFFDYLMAQYTDPNNIKEGDVVYKPCLDTTRSIRTIFENAFNKPTKDDMKKLLKLVKQNGYGSEDNDSVSESWAVINKYLDSDKTDFEGEYEQALEDLFRNDITKIVLTLSEADIDDRPQQDRDVFIKAMQSNGVDKATLESVFQDLDRQQPKWTKAETVKLKEYFGGSKGQDIIKGRMGKDNEITWLDAKEKKSGKNVFDPQVYRMGLSQIMKTIIGGIKRKDQSMWYDFESSLNEKGVDPKALIDAFVKKDKLKGDDELIWHEIDLTGQKLATTLEKEAQTILKQCEPETLNYELAEMEVERTKRWKDGKINGEKYTDFKICMERLQEFYRDLTNCDITSVGNSSLKFTDRSQKQPDKAFTRGTQKLKELKAKPYSSADKRLVYVDYKPLDFGAREHFILFLRKVGERCSKVKRRMKRDIEDGEWRTIEGTNGNWYQFFDLEEKYL